MAGLTAADVPRAETQMGVRLSRRPAVATRSPRSPAAACSSAAQAATSTRSAPRPAASTGSSRPGAACARRSASAASTTGSARVRGVLRRPRRQRLRARRRNRRAAVEDEGRRLPRRPRHRLADVSQRPALCAGGLGRRSRRRDADLRVLPVPRQPRRARRGDRQSRSGRRTRFPKTPKPTTKNKVGTQLWGPSGAPIWSSPAIDARRNALYVTTGNNYSDPATSTSDAFVAFDLTTGKMLWCEQMTPATPGTSACRLPDKTNCPESNGPDFDFASPPILVTLAERPPRARRRTEVRRRPRARSRPRGRSALAGARRQGRHDGRRAVGLGRRRHQRLRGAVRHRPHRADLTARHGRRSEARRRHVRAAARHRPARLVHAAARLRRRARAAARRSRRRSARFPASRSRDRSTATCARTRRPTARSSGTSTPCTRTRPSTASRRGGSLDGPGPAIGGGMSSSTPAIPRPAACRATSCSRSRSTAN